MNVNSNAKRIMVFGDSLSWGYQPGSSHNRYDVQTRWPGKLQALLGNGFEVIEESLNSRGIEHGDSRPGKEGRRGLDYIEPALDSHDPLDLVIVLLGTNELKKEMNQSASQIAEYMKKLISIIQCRPSQFRDTKPKVLILSPPIIDEDNDYCRIGGKYIGATKKSQELKTLYQGVANELGASFLALDKVEVGSDGVHFDVLGHKKVAEIVFHSVKELL